MTQAVVRSGSKQYRVQKGDVIQVELLPGVKGDTVELDEVLLVAGDSGVKVGKPRVAGAKVRARILRQARAKKIIIYTYKCRKSESKRRGHRQSFTELQIEDVEAGV
jgi:large subunit ribosomal protein L21